MIRYKKYQNQNKETKCYDIGAGKPAASAVG